MSTKSRISKEKIAFNNEDLEGTTQPYDNALVVTLLIGGLIVKRVVIY